MTTIYDIAKVAGVSPATVSKVFNNYSEVSEKTREKVFKIAKELKYIPNLSAQSLKTNKSYLIGVIFSENIGIGLDHQFFSVVLESFRKEIGRYGYDTIFINNTLGMNKIGYLEHCKYRNVDGAFIITAGPDDVDMNKLIESKITCVTTDIIYDNIPFISSDNIGGSRLAIEYLYNKGHRKIANVAGPLNTMSGSERFVGYKEGLKEFDLTLNEKYIVEAKGFNYDEAYKATEELLKRFEGHEEDLPTAIFVGADIMSLAVMKALKEKGYSIPKDISIIGFDDIAMAEHMSPALTTVRQDKELIGKTVANVLYQCIKYDKYISEIERRLPVTIVERESVIDINL